jgi:hypothetical protein
MWSSTDNMYLYAFLMTTVRCIVVKQKIDRRMWGKGRISFDKLIMEWASAANKRCKNALRLKRKQ